MNNFDAAVITDEGAALLAKQQVGGCILEFTRIAVGSGTYTPTEKVNTALQARKNLKTEKYSYGLSSKTIENKKTVKLSAVITNRNPETGEALFEDGFNINEMGVFCQEQGKPETEILYSIAVSATFPGEYMPAYTGLNPSEILQDYFVSVANSAEVTINFTAETYALASDLAKKQNKGINSVMTLSAERWNDAEYSLEDEFPSAEFTEVHVYTSSAMTEDQKDAFEAASLTGLDDGSNALKALGDVPEIDLPVKVVGVRA
jgi:hypothetical protein